MNCPKCGNQLKENAKFCDECGTKITSPIICPFCETEIYDSDEKCICPECETIYHKECWNVIDICENCKKECFETINSPSVEITPSESNNDLPVNTKEVNYISQQNISDNYTRPNKKNKIVVAVIAIILIIACILIICVIKTGSIDFSAKYSYMADEPYCTIASDGSYIELDSNPYDIKTQYSYLYDAGDYTIEVVDAIEQINSDLGFTQALSQKMNQTNALQGKQFEENNKYRVTWTYHPDKGLNVIYEKK